ncbi:MAG: hypothetical protein CVU64_05890 [Deltaproteobacteria bacterium HGW-Deltaproteobacteria-21]|nr:MAG: hypothetical protein CVU64_05890 [Deltaproteobacteria bacterium HGW-Deltaproteobacteria-21]
MQKRLPFVISAPHCSSRVPPDIRRSLALTDQEIEESTDIGTKEIFGALPALGVFCASWSRLAIDLNRGPHQRDRKGVVAQVDYSGRTIYREDDLPDTDEVERRIRDYYFPYHQQLRSALDLPEAAGLFDCHSLFGTGPPEAPDPGETRKDITLSNNGDKEGFAVPGLGSTTCPAGLLNAIKGTFEDSGFSVSLNRPYKGGYITTHYGRTLFEKGKMALQIEINQDLYCAPGTLELAPDKVKEVRERINHVFTKIGMMTAKHG